MPNLDWRWPLWQGSKTGKMKGSCTENKQFKGKGWWIACRLNWIGKGFSVKNNCMSLDDKEKILEDRLKEIRAAKQQLN